MRDFTLQTYKQLLISFQQNGYEFMTFGEYCADKDEGKEKMVFLRHDVDLRPAHSLQFAKIEADKGVKSVYYFRAVPESWDESIIREIAEMGHEVGYHYESLTTCNGDVDAAYADFCKNLESLRKIVSVTTICMHGSPRSPYDSKDIWKKYSYKELGILGEPYLDTDFSKLFYMTDTGRRWDGYKVSVRDKIEGHQERWNKDGLSFHSTSDIIKAAAKGRLPDKIMITTHPQRWNDPGWAWAKEAVLQSAKNVVKRVMISLQ